MLKGEGSGIGGGGGGGGLWGVRQGGMDVSFLQLLQRFIFLMSASQKVPLSCFVPLAHVNTCAHADCATSCDTSTGCGTVMCNLQPLRAVRTELGTISWQHEYLHSQFCAYYALHTVYWSICAGGRVSGEKGSFLNVQRVSQKGKYATTFKEWEKALYIS